MNERERTHTTGSSSIIIIIVVVVEEQCTSIGGIYIYLHTTRLAPGLSASYIHTPDISVNTTLYGEVSSGHVRPLFYGGGVCYIHHGIYMG